MDIHNFVNYDCVYDVLLVTGECTACITSGPVIARRQRQRAITCQVIARCQ